MTPVDPQTVTWVRVDPPVFDLWGVLSSSLLMAVICIVVSTVLGGLLGWLRIRRSRDAGEHVELLAGLAGPPLPPSPSL